MAEISDEEKSILKVLKEIGKPATPGMIAKRLGIESKVVSKKIKALREKELVYSPVRCKYAPTEKAKDIL